eukprot:TRINITY_DN5542_c0_g2_i2.p1 TRINITY_DN5542_c0_g2~~TRINITY_DN5542_c0_g2_i2.p1  ORF type:complete len:593 (+),score=173.47 TRINITY_DN5542_c0_g2_i2:54-1781(+)
MASEQVARTESEGLSPARSTPQYRTLRTLADDQCATPVQRPSSGTPSPPRGDGVTMDAVECVMQDEVATFVDATYEDAAWVANRLSSSPSAVAVLSPLHPNTVRGGKVCAGVEQQQQQQQQLQQQQQQQQQARIPAHSARQPVTPPLPPPRRTTPLSDMSPPGRAPASEPLQPPDLTVQTSQDTVFASHHPTQAVFTQAPQTCKVSPPRPAVLYDTVRMPPMGVLEGSPRKSRTPSAAIPSPATPPGRPAAPVRSTTPCAMVGCVLTPQSPDGSTLSADNDTEMALLRSQALAVAADALPRRIAQTVLRMDRENRVLRDVCRDRQTVSASLEKDLSDERKKSQEHIQKAVALSARLEESKAQIRRLKKLVAGVRQTNLPFHNELHQARLDESQRKQREDERVKELLQEQQAAHQERVAALRETLAMRECDRAALERLIDDLCAQHTDDLKRVIEAAATNLDSGRAEAGALRIHLNGVLQMLRRSYTQSEHTRGDDGKGELVRQVRGAREAARRAVEERSREADAHREREKKWGEERAELYRHLRWYDEQFALQQHRVVDGGSVTPQTEAGGSTNI